MEEYLNNLKKEYRKTDVTWHLKLSGWGDLSARIGLLEPPRKNVWFRSFAIAFAVFLILLVGTYQIAQASVPGDPLYPIKRLSEKVVETTSGSNQIVIDHRAEEIVDLSKKNEVDSTNLQKISSEYRENVEEAKREIEESGKPNQRFEESLEKHHSEFDEISRENPEVEDDIKDAREASDHEESGED